MPNCPACQTANPAAAKFCIECGVRMAAGAAAQAVIPLPQSYTPKHLAEKVLRSRAAMQGERKRITVLPCLKQGQTYVLTM